MMTIKYVLQCDNSSCENFGGFVNEPEFTFMDDAEEQAWREAYGHGAEDDADFCPFCGELANLDDWFEVFEEGVLNELPA